jgi:hypothetical protein
MANQRIGNINVENARIIFRNFAGKESKFNAKGKRNFCLCLDDDDAEKLKEIGWNIKYLSPRDPDDAPQAYIQVAVAFENIPPKIWLITGGKKTELNEDTVAALDYAEIENVDLIIRPYVWEVNGKTGIKAYVKNMYVTIVENEFEKKYRNLDEEDDGEDCPF